MESFVVASKALVQVYVPSPDGSTTHQWYMDMSLDQDVFQCKLRTRAQLNDSIKKAFVYLLLDAGHVQSLEICDNNEAVPPIVLSAFVKRASGTSSDDIVALRFALKRNAPLIVPDLVLHRKSSCEDLEALLRVGQCETFEVHVLSSAINRNNLSSLCSAWRAGTLQPAPDGVINSLYVNLSSRKVMTVDQLWSSNPVENPPPCEPSTTPGASNDVPSGPSDRTPSSSSKAHGKRRSLSPAQDENPSKRQSLAERSDPAPWALAIAALSKEISAQGTQIATLNAELSALRGEAQQRQSAPGVDAETQTDFVVEYGSELFPEVEPSDASQGSASTVEITVDDRLHIMEGNSEDRFKTFEENTDGRLIELRKAMEDEKIERERLDAKLDQKIQEVKDQAELENWSLNWLIAMVDKRVDDNEFDLQFNIRNEFQQAIEAKGMELQCRLEDHCESRLEDVEEVVKEDVRVALGNWKWKFVLDHMGE